MTLRLQGGVPLSYGGEPMKSHEPFPVDIDSEQTPHTVSVSDRGSEQ